MVGIANVVERGLCIGCGACAALTHGAVELIPTTEGIRVASLANVSDQALARATRVCPFSDDALNEDELALKYFPKDPTNNILGAHRSIFAGRVAAEDLLTGSSSGGLTTWFLTALLRSGEIDGVLHVGPSEGADLFEYKISRTESELMDRRKSAYYATSMDQVLKFVLDTDGRYALVGVPCFVKAARLLCEADAAFDQRMVVFVGIVCGHMKTAFFAQSLAWQADVPPEELRGIDFRVKNPRRSAKSYDYSVLGIGDGKSHSRALIEAIDGNWGYAAFQPEACNFCDDIFAETADVTFGDAWLPEYQEDWRGTNIVVTRSLLAEELFIRGIETGDIDVDQVGVEDAVRSQAGNVRHRRDGLRIRLADDIANGLMVPQKRVSPGYDHVGVKRVELVRQRRKMSKASLGAFADARSTADLSVYLRVFRGEVKRYRRLSQSGPRRLASDCRMVLRRIGARVARRRSARRRSGSGD